MGSRRTNVKGRQLQQVLDEGYLQCIDNDLTTYARNNYEEKIDWILASQPTILFIDNVETEAPLGLKEDHKPLTFNLNMAADNKPSSPRLSFNFKSANWQLYRKTLNELLSNIDRTKTITTVEEIESYATTLTECISSSTKLSIPPTKDRLTNFPISTTTKNLIDRKHRAYRRWRKTMNENDKKEYYKSKELLTNALRNNRIEKMNQIMSSLSGSKMCSDKVWGTVRKFHNKRTNQSHSGDLIYQNITSNSDHDKVNLFASYFENEIFVEKPDHLPFHTQVRKKVDRIKRILKMPVNRKLTPPITTKEIKTILKQLPNSSPGPDSIHNRCLKNYTTLLVQHLAKIFNSIIDIGHIPNIWKKANIILLLKKKKDKKQPSSYRPISLLSCVGKILEKIIKQRMTKELNERKILPIHQAGFREHKSTMYNIYRLERFAHEHLDKRQHAAVIFFDVKAAFDTVWFDGLIYKLYDLRLPSYLIRYIVSFLDNRTASIEIENTLSKPFVLRSGTPQGSPLSPLLYILYTSDSMNSIHQHTEHGLFADDTALWASSNTITNLKNRLQSSTNEFQNWCNAWKLTIQPSKTELLHFSPHPRKKYKNELEIETEGVIIKPVFSSRYLGIIFDHKLDWRSYVNHIETKVASRISLLRFLAKLNPNANLNTMLILYKSLVRSIIAYGSPILLTANQKIWTRLQIIQNKALKATLGLPIYTSTEYIHKIGNIPEIKTYSTTLLQKAITRARINNDKISEENLLRIQLQIDTK
ncbi:unnamed protein product [Rotaria socialis]|uniref:Reverse transcriptase domain-containing protein n=2 Tax=Rotaria socialis TaxID=392032 RepID=A0A820MMH0_9BILA|nr:unnamed protein product [Rotaria socialis]CAF4374269.1 unnamed protein product [Rotaria socialis]